MDLGLIQLVGVVVGTYSSVFFAAPLLVTLKERRPQYKAHNQKVLARRARAEAGETADAEAATDAGAVQLDKAPARPQTKRSRRRD